MCALKAKVANKAITDDSGYVQGTIKSVLDIDERTEKQGRKEVRYAAQFEFNVIAEGSQKPITFKFWTGQNLNSEQFENEETGNTDYNRFTRLCLQLELIKQSDLKNLDTIELPDIESVEGQLIKFKLIKSRKNPALSIPDISSIELVKVADIKEEKTPTNTAKASK